MARIASPFMFSAYTDNSIVYGANSNWGDTSIENYLYKYFMNKYNSYYPQKAQIYTRYNTQYNSQYGGHHIHVYLVRGTNKSENQRAMTTALETYGFECYSAYLHEGGTIGHDSLDRMVNELKRVFMRYRPHAMAGIESVDNMFISEIDPPSSPKNPFNSVYRRLVTLDITYKTAYVYPLTKDWEKNHRGYRYPAGVDVDEVEDPINPNPELFSSSP